MQQINSLKIKIAYIISSLAKQGPVQVLYDIVSNLDYNKFDVTIITLKKEGQHSIFEKFKVLPIKIKNIENSNKYNLFQLYFKVLSFVKEEKISLIHSHCFRSLILASFLKKHTITIHTIHNYPSLQYSALYGILLGNLISNIIKSMIKGIHFPISCSESIANELKTNDKIIANSITNGITKSPENNMSKEEIRAKLNLDPKFKYFISIGRFSPEKNFTILVQAFIKANLPNTKLIILGEGKLLDKIKTISNENIILPGFKSNVIEYIAACDYYISTSLTEGMPLSVLEAMSFGLPLSLSVIPPHKEIFSQAKNIKLGVLFLATVEQEIIDAIKALSNEDYTELQKNIKNTFENFFTSNRMSQQYQELYNKACNIKY